MKSAFAFVAILLLFSAAGAAELKPAVEDSIMVTVVGTLRTGIIAIGGETTGTTITAKGITWELDFGKSGELQSKSKTLDQQKVVVTGTLERRKGVEIKERWIVTVTALKSAGDADR